MYFKHINLSNMIAPSSRIVLLNGYIYGMTLFLNSCLLLFRYQNNLPRIQGPNQKFWWIVLLFLKYCCQCSSMRDSMNSPRVSLTLDWLNMHCIVVATVIVEVHLILNT